MHWAFRCNRWGGAGWLDLNSKSRNTFCRPSSWAHQWLPIGPSIPHAVKRTLLPYLRLMPWVMSLRRLTACLPVYMWRNDIITPILCMCWIKATCTTMPYFIVADVVFKYFDYSSSWMNMKVGCHGWMSEKLFGNHIKVYCLMFSFYSILFGSYNIALNTILSVNHI